MSFQEMRGRTLRAYHRGKGRAAIGASLSGEATVALRCGRPAAEAPASAEDFAVYVVPFDAGSAMPTRQRGSELRAVGADLPGHPDAARGALIPHELGIGDVEIDPGPLNDGDRDMASGQIERAPALLGGGGAVL
jgi:hypothetical protein